MAFIDKYLLGLDTDIESPDYARRQTRLAINRPTQDWSRPLQDASWRRWFDVLKSKGVTGLGPMRQGGQGGTFEDHKERERTRELAMRDAIYNVTKKRL